MSATVLLVGAEGPLARRLRDRGIRVRAAATLPQALAALGQEAPDLVVADLSLCTAAFVSEVRGLTTAPVVAVGAERGRQVVDLLRAGATECVTRTMDLDVAAARVEAQLRRRGLFPEEGAFEVEPGVLLGPYRIEHSLGHGGMGDVYLARDERLGRPVAVKVLPGDLAHRPEVAARFSQEARALARLNHPGIVSIYDVGDRPVPYLVLEVLEGENLAARLERGVLPVDEAARLVRDVARTLQEVHDHGILHRDMKPANLMLDSGGAVRLLDFGLARLLDDEVRLSSGGTVLGTPAYMAPEQVDDSYGDVDERTDVYALGLVLYEALVGYVPFRDLGFLALLQEITCGSPISPARERPEVPAELDRICLKATDRRRARRYASAGAMADDLDRFLSAR